MAKQRVLARRLQSRLEVLELTPLPDGFGGSTVTEKSLGFYWADVNSVGSGGRTATNLVALGITDFSDVLKLEMRYYTMFQNPKNLRIKKGGLLYEIMSVSNVDIRNIKCEIMVKQYHK